MKEPDLFIAVDIGVMELLQLLSVKNIFNTKIPDQHDIRKNQRAIHMADITSL